MLNLNDTRLFVRVVDCGGFTAAARELAVPKSTLSKRVGQLEQALGVQLLRRSSRHFAVTEVGQTFLGHARAMLIEADAAADAVAGQLAEPAGDVRVTASVPTAQLRLAPVLPDLSRSLPKVRLLLDATDRFVDPLREGFDLVLRDHFAPLPDSRLVQRRLCHDPALLVAAPAYLHAHGTPSSPAQLGAHEGLIVSHDATVWSLSRADANGACVPATPRPRLIANESTVLLSAARAGLGIACLPSSLCGPLVAAGELARVLPDWTAGGVTTTLLIPQRRSLLPSVRAVADFLVQWLAH